MESAESGLLALLTECVQCCPGLGYAAHSVDEIAYFIDAEYRFSVYAVIVRPFEIVVDQMVGETVHDFG